MSGESEINVGSILARYWHVALDRYVTDQCIKISSLRMLACSKSQHYLCHFSDLSVEAYGSCARNAETLATEQEATR